jgi:site-specific DNA-methyltransferase (adenine-specific)
MTTFYKLDCVEVLKKQTSKSVHLIYFDPPFATTGHYWDKSLDWKTVFEECFRVLRDDGTLVIHCAIPFNYELIRVAPKLPSYTWYWKKNIHTGFLSSKHQPLRCVEEILVWRNKKTTYYPQRQGEEEHIISAKKNRSCGYFKGHVEDMPIQKVKGRLPKHLLEYNVKIDDFSTRPSALVEFFIQSYTQEGDTVMDLTCYKGMSGVITKKLGRRWIGCDLFHYPTLLMTT